MQVIRRVLPHASDFKRFWKDSGPFEFALTSTEYPPVLLAPEEWIFGHTVRDVLETLMGFSLGKAKVVRSEFNPQNTRILRPDNLIPWKIQPFPKEWNHMPCDFFTPEGHLTRVVADRVAHSRFSGDEAQQVTAAFSIYWKIIWMPWDMSCSDPGEMPGMPPFRTIFRNGKRTRLTPGCSDRFRYSGPWKRNTRKRKLFVKRNPWRDCAEPFSH